MWHMNRIHHFSNRVNWCYLLIGLRRVPVWSCPSLTFRVNFHGPLIGHGPIKKPARTQVISWDLNLRGLSLEYRQVRYLPAPMDTSGAMNVLSIWVPLVACYQCCVVQVDSPLRV